MSHITEMKMPQNISAIDDLEAIQQAARLMGGEFIEGKKTYKWYGRYVGDSTPPAWLTPDLMGKCDHVIKFPDINYEVGVLKVGDEYKFVYDYWDGQLKTKIGGADGAALAKNYADAKTQLDSVRLLEQKAKNMGLRARRLNVEGSNTIKVEVEGYR